MRRLETYLTCTCANTKDPHKLMRSVHERDYRLMRAVVRQAEKDQRGFHGVSAGMDLALAAFKAPEKRK